jgi:hypothetical protein
MNQWTDSARTKLEQYLAQLRQTVAASGADVNEVTEDLRRHVEQEVSARNLGVVTEQDVGQILARIGTPEAATALADPQPVSLPGTGKTAAHRKPPGWWLLVFGVVIPLGTVVFEFVTGACAGIFFDPLPTLGHVVLTTLVPVANLLVWLAVRRGDLRWRARLGWANGFAIGIASAYALLFLPLTPLPYLGSYSTGSDSCLWRRCSR